jgi:hypothetical protein
MWARVIELMLACWLALSPFIFVHDPTRKFLWINDFTCSCAVALFALLSFWDRWEKSHLLTLAVGFWLYGVAFATFPDPASPAQQNGLLVGLLLSMLAIVPSHAEHPPRPWQEFYKKH